MDDNVEIPSRFQIMSIPATILFKDGKPVEQEIGMLSSERLKKRLLLLTWTQDPLGLLYSDFIDEWVLDKHFCINITFLKPAFAVNGPDFSSFLSI
ncbi:thioredoxin family protein [Paenibacillus amylolyticus]|uniref:thioredoxin family protein n=1 Tax=Paenibacillus TaxID=44249 RepID=UPI00117CE127